MRRKNKQLNGFMSMNRNLSFKTGNLLLHPSGMQTYKEQSRIVQEQRQKQTDINMLNRPPDFVNRRRDSDEIDSDIQNAPSDFKRYEEIRIVGKIYGRQKFTTLVEQKVGVEYSQLDEDQQDELKYEPDQMRRSQLNPQTSIPRNSSKNSELFVRINQTGLAKPTQNQKSQEEKQKSIKIQRPADSFDSEFDIPINTQFKAYLEQVEERNGRFQPFRM